MGQPYLTPDNDGFMIRVINEGTVDVTVSWLEFCGTPDSAYMRDFHIDADHCGFPIPDGLPGIGPDDTVRFTAPVTIAPYGAQMVEIAFLVFRDHEIYPPGMPVDVRGKTFVFRFSDGSAITVNP